MRHWFLSILLCLLIGVVTTVGVAWGSSLFVYVRLGDDKWAARKINGDYWVVIDARAFGLHLVQSIYSDNQQFSPMHYENDTEAMIPYWGTLPSSGEHIIRDETQFHNRHIEGRGWPMICLWSELLIDSKPGTFKYTGVEGGIETSHPWMFNRLSIPRVLPYRPIWFGFLINIIFYAGIWFALIFGWRAHIRVIRRWQGHCPMCKYDLRGGFDSGCSECGWNRND